MEGFLYSREGSHCGVQVWEQDVKFSRLISSVKNETGTLAKARPNPDLPRVLLVEDEQPIRDIIVPWLFRDGFDCREAADGRAAIALLAAGTRTLYSQICCYLW